MSIGFISCTPSCSSASPLSTFRNGTTFFSSHRYWAVGTPSMSRSMVCSNRIAARTREPSNAGLVMHPGPHRVDEVEHLGLGAYRSSATPYSASALGVLPPLWSRAAKNPRPVLIFSNWVMFTFPYSGTSPAARPHVLAWSPP